MTENNNISTSDSDISMNNSEENPFAEEFDKKDVVNKEEIDPQNPFDTEFDKKDVVNRKDEDGYSPEVSLFDLDDDVIADVLSENSAAISDENVSLFDMDEEQLDKFKDDEFSADDDKFTDDAEKSTSDDEKTPDIDSITGYDEELRKAKSFNDISKRPDVDVDSVLNYSEEKRKEKSFTIQFGATEDTRTLAEISEQNFSDYLIYRKISGSKEGHLDQCRISADDLTDKGEVIEISDDLELKNDELSRHTTVITHRDKDDVVEFIEIICHCGHRTLIKMDYENGYISAETDGEHDHIRLIDDIPESDDQPVVDYISDDSLNATEEDLAKAADPKESGLVPDEIPAEEPLEGTNNNEPAEDIPNEPEDAISDGNVASKIIEESDEINESEEIEPTKIVTTNFDIMDDDSDTVETDGIDTSV